VTLTVQSARGDSCQHEPVNADAYLRRGHAYLIKDRWTEAVRDLSTAIRLEPKNAVADYLRSFARESQSVSLFLP
jgi:hypothetical protein